METRAERSSLLVNPAEENQLLKVCSLLNEAGANYIVIGAYAMMLNGIIRATADVDILIEESLDNYRRVIDGLSRMADGAAKELTPQDFVENVVVKIGDEVEVDVSTRAWTVTYAEAATNALESTIEGVRIRFLSLPDLIRSKQTYREQDRADVENLRRLL